MLIKAGAEIRNLGDVKWLATEIIREKTVDILLVLF